MAPREEELIDEEPPSIEPYEVLGISKSAIADEVKSAYRKAALKHHPDKAPEELKDAAHIKFQKVAFAYAVLSDPIRRKRYDATGSTSESITDSDGFSWTDFYHEQFRDIVTGEAIEKFAKGYKKSVEERDDLLDAFRKCKGKMSGVYCIVMLSDPLEDEERFRKIIDAAIASGEVEAYKAYTNETEKSKAGRMKNAQREGKEAMAHAEKLGVKNKLFGTGGRKESQENALAALIQKRHAGRSNFLDDLEAKYAGNGKDNKGKKRASKDEVDDMPSEEAFRKMAERLNKNKATAEAAAKVADTPLPKMSKRAKR